MIWRYCRAYGKTSSRTGDRQNRVDECQPGHGQGQRNGSQQDDGRSQHAAALLFVLLPEANGNQRRSANPISMLKAKITSIAGNEPVMPAIPFSPMARLTNHRSTKL